MGNDFCLASFFVVAPFGRKGTDKRPERERETGRFVFVSRFYFYVNDALYPEIFIKAFHIPLQDISGSVTQTDSTEND